MPRPTPSPSQWSTEYPATLRGEGGDGWQSIEQTYRAPDGAAEARLEQARKVAPAVMVIDSVQMIYNPAIPAGPGSITQLRRCCSELVYLAKASGIAVVLSSFVFPSIIAIRKHGWFDNVVDTFEAVGTKPHILVGSLLLIGLIAESMTDFLTDNPRFAELAAQAGNWRSHD